MGTFLTLWYLKSPAWAWEFYMRTVNGLEISLGVRDMLHNLRRPLFQDYTWQGRLIGLLIRLFRIAFGLFLYALLAIFYLAVYLFWLAFPFVCLVSLIGSFAGTS